uniref:Uncharacterized protein n=1 Tax=Proteus mirabilis TaxID=584 RepID=A0A1L5JNB3_PROMI|nr:hypothetical protein [Proteus mirabilis]APO16955.1 hypothetical protein [Proteus mirabilis]APO17039.1 hypothetical protein [Proteus mirabilis]
MIRIKPTIESNNDRNKPDIHIILSWWPLTEASNLLLQVT